MDVKFLFPFVDAVSNVVPSLGFSNISRNNFKLSNEKSIKNKGIMVAIELFGMLRGYVIYNFTRESADNIAEKMIFRTTAIKTTNDISIAVAQSALGELSNILAANATIALEGYGIMIDISPPKIFYGDINIPSNNQIKHFVVNFKLDNDEFELNTLITKK